MLLGIAAHQFGELADLEAGEVPVGGVDRSGLLVLVENEAGERRFGAGDVGADVANDQSDVIGMALGGQRAFAGVVGERHQEHHSNQDQGGEQAGDRGPAAPPVEPDCLPVPHHPRSLAPLTIWGKPKVPSKSAQSMQPVARPAAANMPRISPTWSLVCSAHSEQRSKVMLAGVAGGRARFT